MPDSAEVHHECVCMLVTGNTPFNMLIFIPIFSFTIYSSTPYLTLGFLSRVLIIHPQVALRRLLLRVVNIRMLFCTNDFCTPRTESICSFGSVLPTSRALFSGSWYDNDFIGRLLTNVTTLKRIHRSTSTVIKLALIPRALPPKALLPSHFLTRPRFCPLT